MSEKQTLPPPLKRTQITINTAIYLQALFPPAAILLTTWATLLILAKSALPEYHTTLLHIIPICLLPIPITAWKTHRNKRFFTQKDTITYADAQGTRDGTIITAWETKLPLPQNEQNYPQTTLKATHQLKRWLPPLLYTAAALLAPAQPIPTLKNTATASIQNFTEPIQQRIQEARQILPEKTAKQYQQQIYELQKKSGPISREKWEALENINANLNQALQDQALQYQALQDALDAQAQALQPSENSNSPLTPEHLTPEMLKQLQKIAQQNGPLTPQMQKALQQLQQQAFDPNQKADTQKAREALNQLRQNLQRKLSQCQGLTPQPENQPGNQPGKGGVNRGPGEAPLNPDRSPAPQNPAAEQRRIENPLKNFQDLQKAGITRFQPDPAPARTGAADAAAPAPADAPAIRASQARLSPAHRSAVARYFKRQEQQP